MSKKKAPKVFLRMTAIFMALFMIAGEPARAFAAEIDYSDGEVVEEVESYVEDEFFSVSEEAQEPVDETQDYEVADPEDDDYIPEEVLEQFIGGTEADQEDVTASDEVTDKKNFVEIPTEDESDSVLRMLVTTGQYDPENLGDHTPIPETAYTIKRYADYISVTNNAEGSNPEDGLYAALVYADENKQGKIYLIGTEVSPGKTTNLSTVYDSNRNKTLIDATTDYVLWLGKPESYTDPDTGKKTYYKFLGYLPQYDDDYNVITIDGVPQYEKADMEEILVPAAESYDEYEGSWKDGYTGINLKATVQSNLTSVKLTWKLDTKNKPDQKEYKKFEVYRLIPDSKEATGYKEELLREAKTSKTFTHKNIDAKKDSLLYLIKCLNAEEKTVAEYVTLAAPRMLQMQSGDTTGDFDFIMNIRPDDVELYMLEIAGQNKEYNEIKAPRGYQKPWTTIYQVDDGFGQGNSIGEFYISAKKKPEAMQLAYNIGAPSVEFGKQYYGRIQSVAYVNGLKVTSAPSNVLSCKAGPNKCHVLTSAGVYYDKTDANRGNYNNKARASEHINAYLNGDEISPTSQIYVHDTNTDVCYKDGLIYFIVDKDDVENIKSFDLLKCPSGSGKFTKVKNFTLTNKALMECTIDSEFFSNIVVYAMYYNNFIPEKDTYYAVRAIAKAKSAPGGRGAGVLISSKMDVVQSLVTSDSGPSKIKLTWQADDCVKSYWIYRSEHPYTGGKREKTGQSGDILIAKVGIGSAKKYTYSLSDDDETNIKTIKLITYTDKPTAKNPLVIDKNYYYYVRPVYKAATAIGDIKAYMEYCSEEVKGKASALYAQITGFKAANEATKQIRISFNQVKNINHYRIFRLEVDKNTTKLTADMKPDLTVLYDEADKQDFATYEEFEDFLSGQPESRWKEIITGAGTSTSKWEYVTTLVTKGTSTASKSYIDNSVKVGSYYYYLIQGASDKSSSVNFTYTARVRNLPLPVTSASARYDSNNNRIVLSWQLNSKDANKSHLTVQVSTDGSDNWANASKTGYNHNNPRKGRTHTYLVRVRYSDGTVTAYSNTVKLVYSLPSGIEVTKASTAGTLDGNYFYIYKGEEGKLSYRAYLEDGSTSEYNKVTRSNTPDGNDTITITESTDNSFTFTGAKVGQVSYELNCAGITRKITIVVSDKSK